MKAHNNHDVARMLIQKAMDDERTVELIEQAEGPWGVGCFHCQQAAEKRLKAILILCTGTFPRTHDIDRLLHLVAPYCKAIGDLPDEVMLLGEYAVAVRYDDMVVADLSSFEENKKWLNMIKQALETVDVREAQ